MFCIIKMKMKMKNFCLLLFLIGFAVDVGASALSDARSYFEKGKRYFRQGDYKSASFQFEFASFHHSDGTVSADSVKIMSAISAFCKIHRDSGNVCYERRKYDEAYMHYALVARKNQFDSVCRQMMTTCEEKGRMMRVSTSAMVRMEPGFFMMGRNDGPDNEQPAHTVHLDAFYMDKYEVTNSQFASFLSRKGVYDVEQRLRIFIESPGCHIRYDATEDTYSVEDGYEDFPVLGVTWYGANDYAVWVGKSLPTEAQWEYAFGDAEASDGGYFHNVRSGKPNKFGICGMSDNGSEWVSDSYVGNAYLSSDTRNPEHHEVREYKTVRGGSSLDDDFNARTFRDYERPSFGGGGVGFRCVKNIVNVK